ncbi:MAG: B12-binding domain-containing radical SAM protein [Acidobacteriota bacterium]
MPKRKIVLLNPPGRRLYLRDYFCSKVSQADYINHPIDFLYLSGLLKDVGEVSLLDAIVQRLDARTCLDRVERLDPDVVVGLIGSVSYSEDVPFYRSLSQRVGARLVLIGDILIDHREERLAELPFVSAFLHDFSSDDLRIYLEGAPDGRRPNNMTVRERGGISAFPIERPKGEEFSLPVPQHRLFLGHPYRYPFVRHRRFATVMTEFGCPYSCNFCIMSTLGWKIRPVSNVLEELDSLARLRVREIFFLDQTFGIGRERAQQLLSEMQRVGYGFGWLCFSRPDVVSDRLLLQMKAAGCHTVILGVESANQRILRAARKDYTREAIQEGFQLCARHGIRTVATVIIGLPEETEESFQETLALLRRLGPDFVSFNVAVPRMGTPLRQRALSLGLIESDFEIMDQSGHPVAMQTLTLSRARVAAMKQRALGEFYFNLGYLGERARKWGKSWNLSDLRIQLRQGVSLLRHYLSSS